MELSVKIIQQAMAGESFAIHYLLEFYGAYMNALAYVEMRDIDGICSRRYSYELKEELQAELLTLIHKFHYEVVKTNDC